MPDIQTSKHFLLRGKGWLVANRFATPGVPPWPACWRAEFQRNDFGLWKGPRVALGHGSNPPIGETWIRDQSGETQMFQDLERFVMCGHLSVRLSVHVALYPPFAYIKDSWPSKHKHFLQCSHCCTLQLLALALGVAVTPGRCAGCDDRGMWSRKCPGSQRYLSPKTLWDLSRPLCHWERCKKKCQQS